MGIPYMMGSYYGGTWLGLVTTVLMWSLLIAGIIVLVQWALKNN